MCKNIFLPLVLSFCFSVFAEAPFSLGANTLFTVNLGTSCEEPELNAAISKSKDMGMDAEDSVVCDVGGNIFFRYNFLFNKRVGIEADLSFFRQNGISESISSSDGTKITYSYSYKSFEFEPLIIYTLPYKRFDFTFSAGPNFSFPFGNVEHEYSYIDKKNSDFELKTHFVPGLTFGTSAGFVVSAFEIFLAAKYVLDFCKVEYETGSSIEKLLQRRCLDCGIGVRYTFPEKTNKAASVNR